MMRARAKTVLLVEDNADNQAVYRVILEHLGFTAQRVAFGPTAHAAA